mmetsp:Transcript_49529/g.98958  ORF Transcript_49529/g.98958 Transcript_49529/m.98958 type:complete len:106 (-) Transcript_49529:52-369(-)|eukprot:CAMPEP_0196718562 /NCGR_PEP_ID=MMETSP1091-20130531/1742_1 /TAXON_ID=302021 /ORGANISM="Rhodomonas sp., Strain CCMP768" /LENGTH=105 /DNA_ID=CAMNT_0042059255 /DNA_START=53 /DNA_END=370 /DNA_ORIENTATION=+
MGPKEFEEKLQKARKAKGSPKISLSDVALHNKEKDCWIVIDGCVYDVTKYMLGHPGGKMAILRHAGKDCTEKFNQRHTSLPNAWNKLAELYVGDVRGGCLGCGIM